MWICPAEGHAGAFKEPWGHGEPGQVCQDLSHQSGWTVRSEAGKGEDLPATVCPAPLGALHTCQAEEFGFNLKFLTGMVSHLPEGPIILGSP